MNIDFMIFEIIDSEQTKINQRLFLKGIKAANFVEGMKLFEKTAPQGLAKLAKAIEAEYLSK